MDFSDALNDPEFAMVAACCRPIGQEGRAEAIVQTASRVADFQRLLTITRGHRVAGLVEQGLRSAAICLPAEVDAELAVHVRTARQQMLRNAGEEARLGAALQRAGIDAVFVKGATLARLAYSSFAYKMSWDIDLLVLRGEACAAASVLTDCGYRMQPESAPELAKRLIERNRETIWRNADRLTSVELHWALDDNPQIARKIGMNSPRQQVEVAPGAFVSTLDSSILALYLCIHGNHHSWSRLKWLADFAALIDRQKLDLKSLQAHAKAIGIEQSVNSGIALMNHILAVGVHGTTNLNRGTAHLVAQSLASIASTANADAAQPQPIFGWLKYQLHRLVGAHGFRYLGSAVIAELMHCPTSRQARLPTWMLPLDAVFVRWPIAIGRVIFRSMRQMGGKVAAKP